MNTLNSKEAYIQMDKAAEEWSKWAEKVIILDEGKKAMFAKCFLKHKIQYKYFENCLVLMSTGGKSGKNFKSYLTSSKEINISLKSNLYYSNIFITFLRFPIKLLQFFYK